MFEIMSKGTLLRSWDIWTLCGELRDLYFEAKGLEIGS